MRTGQDNIVFEVKEVKSRLTNLESITAGGRRDGALQQEEIYSACTRTYNMRKNNML